MPSHSAGRWEDILAAMEADLAATRSGAWDATSPPPWAGPEHIGRMPQHLEERARHILLAQRAVIGQLQDAQRTTGQHLAMLRSVPVVLGDGRSVYLDVTS